MNGNEVGPTALQEAVWWVCRRVGDPSVYHISWRLACGAPLDLAALRASWQAVVDRHEALRWSVAHGANGLTATIQDEVPAPVRLIEPDAQGSVPADVLLRAIAEESHREPFDLGRAPLARLTVVRVGDRHELILTVHHIAVDGLGTQLLFTDLAEAYDAVRHGGRPVFAAEAASWRAFAREERATRDTGGWQDGVDHWRTVLEGAKAATVAADRGVYAGTGGAGTTLRHTFSEQAVRGLAALAKEASATSFAVVLAALQILLARAGAGDDVVIGTVAANRLGPREQRLVGYLVNQCLIRTRVTQEDTVSEVVGRASEAAWEMFAHQSVPYPLVFSALPEPTRSALGDIAPVMLNHLGAIGSGLRLGDVELTQCPSLNIASRTDMGIAYWHTEGGGLMAEVEYSTLRYDADTALRLLRDLDTVLSYGTTPGARVGEIRVGTRAVLAYADQRAPASLPDRSEPSSGAERDVRDVWSDVLGCPPASLDEDFFEAGGHSLTAVQFVAALTDLTGTPLDLATWLADPTPRAILAQLDAPDTADRPSTVVRLRPGPGRHLHLFAGAAGSPQDYRELIAALPPDWRVTFSQEREPRTEAETAVPAMAARFRADLDAAELRPDVLAGWSMGGQLAFEVAVGYDERPPGVVLIDPPPPVGAALTLEPLADFVATVGLALGVDDPAVTVPAGTDPESAEHLPDALLLLSAQLRAAGHDLPHGLMADRWATYERHYRAVAAYESDRVLAAPAALLAADLTDQGVTVWADRFKHDPAIARLAADHYTALRAPAVDVIATTIEEIAEASTLPDTTGRL
ncbi:condensation domain-containing protein [Streptomyces sp. B21-083]|uniref:condensation domain-containing protein n=1 Tax=Streptomyces sp. B21-083 TaxID=3039410 RepID=UPI002FF04FF3